MANFDLQRAIYSAIEGAGIAGLVQIVDHPITEPSPSDYPFIEIGDSQALPVDESNDAGTSSDTGVEEFVDIHTWSRYSGQKETKEIMAAVYSALHHQTLTVSGRTSAHCWLDGDRVLNDPDGLTRHGVQTFRITHRNRS